MRQQVAAIAREAQSAAYRPKKTSAAVPVKPNPPEYQGYGVKQPASTLPPVENNPEDIADAYLSGMTIQQIADEVGVSAGRIRQQLADMDLIF